jgi:hypothetical protein
MAHNHPASQNVVLTHIHETSGKLHSPTLIDQDMHDPATELRRIPLLGTSVNKPPADVPQAAWWHHVHSA